MIIAEVLCQVQPTLQYWIHICWGRRPYNLIFALKGLSLI